MAAVYEITNPSVPACAQRRERPRGARHRAATEQAERYVTRPFRCADLRGVSHGISEEAPDAADHVPDYIVRAG